MESNQVGRTALVVIDMQRAIVNGPSTPHDRDLVLTRIHALIAAARAAGALVVFVQHCSAPGTPCEKGTPGWELVEGLTPGAGDLLIQKFRPSAFQGSGLQEQLHGAGVSRLVVAGMKTEYCIDTSCRAASDLGFRVVLAADAHTTVDSPVLPASTIVAHHTLTLGGPFAQVVASEQIRFR